MCTAKNTLIDFSQKKKIFKWKGRGLTQSYDKSLPPTEKSKKQRDNIKTLPKNFDNTTIADRLRTVSWSNGSNSHPTGMVKPVYERSTFPLPQQPCNQKDTHLKICKYSSL